MQRGYTYLLSAGAAASAAPFIVGLHPDLAGAAASPAPYHLTSFRHSFHLLTFVS